MNIFDFLENFTFPRICYYCQFSREPYNADYLCTTCLHHITHVEGPKCLNLENSEDQLTLVAACAYEGVARDLILRFKSGHAHFLAPLFAKLIHMKLESFGIEYDYIVPIPLHTIRLLQRGFNQTAYIGHYLSKLSSRGCLYSILKRVKQTAPLKSLPRQKRAQEVQSAFRASQKDVYKTSKILLFDDVCTSGATLCEAARALRQAGFTRVVACAIAMVDS